jgi:hypothetical protein
MVMVQGRSDLSAPAEGIAELQRNGVTPEQCRRLVALRARIRDGGYGDDSLAAAIGGAAFGRRLAFARWLVRCGRLSEFDVCGGRM